METIEALFTGDPAKGRGLSSKLNNSWEIFFKSQGTNIRVDNKLADVRTIFVEN